MVDALFLFYVISLSISYLLTVILFKTVRLFSLNSFALYSQQTAWRRLLFAAVFLRLLLINLIGLCCHYCHLVEEGGRDNEE